MSFDRLSKKVGHIDLQYYKIYPIHDKNSIAIIW